MKDDIVIAKTAGFCMGVRRAVEIALDEANIKNKGSEIFTFGPLIHNPQVLKLLEDKKIQCIEEIPEKGKGTIIIRAHGIPPQSKKKLEQAGFEVVDATCPRVIKVQAIIKKHSAEGYDVIIAGDHDHAEVIGLLGYAGEKGHVINSIEEFENLPAYEKAIVVAQTTQNTKFYKDLEKTISEKFPDYKFFNTICDSTEKRQEEIKEISKDVDAVVVVGGKTSGNTKRLKEVASQEGKTAFHIENESELDMNFIAAQKKIGITAGASTPNWVISQVYKEIKTARLKKEKSALLCCFIVLKFLFRSNILLAAGAGALTTAAAVLLDIPLEFPTVLTASLYIFSIHTINNLTLIDSDRFNDPQKANMYEKYKFPLSFAAVFAGFLCIAMSFSLGILPFIAVIIMTIAGLCYKLPIVNIPKITNGFEPLSRIKGSKALLIAGAWGMLCTILPIFSANDFSFSKIPGILVVFIFCASMAFFRTIWFDILAIQGNKIAGEITIPILYGEKRTSDLIKYLILSMIFLLFISSFTGIISNFGYLLMIYPAISLIFILINTKKEIQPGFFDDLITESFFLTAGILALIWKIFS
ncbi:MAG: 4-hydroxy-3-methylbut-2-enyl diphosphate reductase [Desulfobacteraceae bacterium]|nr:4-hydroxy-3-methylbut-2-enyl diphosphate reductase [Desulfobacteraceae bacterium]